VDSNRDLEVNQALKVTNATITVAGIDPLYGGGLWFKDCRESRAGGGVPTPQFASSMWRAAKELLPALKIHPHNLDVAEI